VVALAIATLGAVRGGQIRNAWMEFVTADLERMEREKGLSNGICANPSYRKPLSPDAPYWQSRGLKLCSLQCSW
jgi:hypothetical protein